MYYKISNFEKIGISVLSFLKSSVFYASTMKLLEALLKARDDAFEEGPEGRLQMPFWLKWSLIALIIINIISYIAVTWITVDHIDRQIALLHAANASNHEGMNYELARRPKLKSADKLDVSAKIKVHSVTSALVIKFTIKCSN